MAVIWILFIGLTLILGGVVYFAMVRNDRATEKDNAEISKESNQTQYIK